MIYHLRSLLFKCQTWRERCSTAIQERMENNKNILEYIQEYIEIYIYILAVLWIIYVYFFHVQYISYISASLHIWAYLGSPKHWVFTNSTMSQGLQILQLLGSKPRNEAPWHRWRINHAPLCPPKKANHVFQKVLKNYTWKDFFPPHTLFFSWQSTSLCFLWNLSHSARTETG